MVTIWSALGRPKSAMGHPMELLDLLSNAIYLKTIRAQGINSFMNIHANGSKKGREAQGSYLI